MNQHVTERVVVVPHMKRRLRASAALDRDRARQLMTGRAARRDLVGAVDVADVEPLRPAHLRRDDESDLGGRATSAGQIVGRAHPPAAVDDLRVNREAGAIAAVPDLSGTASGLSGFVGTIVGASVTQLLGNLADGTPMPLVVVLVACTAGALTCALAALGSPLAGTTLEARAGRAA